MRHKQRPIKSSKHKSVTLLSDSPQTSFEHNNVRHMNDVMRLAFLENNDITPETWKDIDFNSLSTANILKRNIQQQLQQQLQEQEHQAKQQQQLLFQQQLLNQQRYREDAEEREAAEAQLRARRREQQLLFQQQLIQQQQQRRRKEAEERVAAAERIRTGSDSPKPAVNLSGEYLCDEPDCGKSFPSLRKLRHHKVVHSDDFPFHCQFAGCEKKFKRKFGIDLHSTTHFDLDPEMYRKTSNNSSLPFFGRRMQYSMCKPCGQKFKTVLEYQHHMLNHGKDPFKCPVSGCGQTFSIWKSFQKHRASHYFNYYCQMDPRCEHFTSNLQLLKLHIYCCHFQRKLPENATLSSKDATVEGHSPKGASSLSQDSLIEDDVPTFDPVLDEIDETIERNQRYYRDDSQQSLREQSESALVVDEEAHEDEAMSNSTVHSPPYVPQDQSMDYDGSAGDGCAQEEEDVHPDSMQLSISSAAMEEDPLDDGDLPDDAEESAIVRTPTRLRNMSKTSDGNDRRMQMLHEEIRRTALRIYEKRRDRADQFEGQERDRAAKRQATERNRVVDSSSPKPTMNLSGEYLCDDPDCGKSFPSLRKLRHHKVVHSDDFPFHCQFAGCEKKFKRKFGIDLHSTTHFDLDPEMYRKTSNNSSLPFFGRRMQYSMCKPCGQKFKTVLEYQQHMLNHGKEPFKCPVKGCGQTFSIWKSFQKHRASHYFNYYCQMDPRCEHFTSNLQLLKLHIYCCHFQRKLPENATLSSKDAAVEESPMKSESIPSQDSLIEDDASEGGTAPLEIDESIENSQKSTPSTPRRDPRLRRNPPRSSTFGHQDYASISNGSSFAKITMASPSAKRARTSASSAAKTPEKTSPKEPAKVLPRRSCATSMTPKKESKPTLKVLPKRSAQRLPMSLIAAADDESTEDDYGSEAGSSRNHSRNNSSLDNNADNLEGGFRCHLCDYKFSVRFQLTKHLSTHLELSPDMYSATADATVIQISERRRREFFCDKCNVKFEQMSDLDSHMRKHGQRPYVCSFCQVPSSFRMAKQYLSHLYEHRFNYKCTMSPDCDFTINRKDALKLHIFRMHMNQKLPAYIENFANMVDCNEWAG